MTKVAFALAALFAVAAAPYVLAAPLVPYGDTNAARDARPSQTVQLQAQADDLARQLAALQATVRAQQQQLRAQQQQIDAMNTRLTAKPQGYISRMAITKGNFGAVPNDALMEFWVR